MKNSSKSNIWLICLLLLFTACDQNQKPQEQETIKIGSILPLTGAISVYGNYAKKGQEKAVKYLNEEVFKNKKIELIIEDGKGIPTESINAFRKLRNEDIQIFTSTISHICLALTPIAKKENVLLFADAAHPDITKDMHPLIFRHSSVATQEAEMLTQKLKEKKKKKLAILYLNDDYGTTLSNSLQAELENENFEMIETLAINKDDKDHSLSTIKIKESNPDIIVLAVYGQTGALLLKSLKTYMPNIDILASIGFIITNSNQIAGDAAKGVEYIDFDFQNQFNTTDEEVSSFEMLEYGTIMMIGEAIQQVGEDPIMIANYIKEKQSFDLGQEKVVLNKKHDLIPNLVFKKIE